MPQRWASRQTPFSGATPGESSTSYCNLPPGRFSSLDVLPESLSKLRGEKRILCAESVQGQSRSFIFYFFSHSEHEWYYLGLHLPPGRYPCPESNARINLRQLNAAPLRRGALHYSLLSGQAEKKGHVHYAGISWPAVSHWIVALTDNSPGRKVWYFSFQTHWISRT